MGFGHWPSDPSTSKDDWVKLKAASLVRIRWDPERDLHLQPLPYRAIQIGIGREAVPRYVEQWVQRITDITDLAHTIHNLVCTENLNTGVAVMRSAQNGV
ncbi:DUF4291 family protein [Nitrobacter vulgaris]|uniref:Uncharacterized protein n=1 Tax=Nitrobacter vulgaris TaxID=29421 RepID=A0A1V4I0L5_NITVU|nr:DUF4291 family protein [Nitrobacter vulgaris]OPH83788.1 hypothetical protein B2M20_05100 [Nitrobacter vulgaris]